MDALEVENLDAQQVNVRLMDENRNLFCTVKKLKSEHAELSKMKQTILSSLGQPAAAVPTAEDDPYQCTQFEPE